MSLPSSLTGLSPYLAGFPKTILLSLKSLVTVRTLRCTHLSLGSFHFARRYSGNRIFFLFLRVLRCFSSPGSLCMAMYSPYSNRGFLCQVSPFRNQRVNGYLLLTVAYRSLSRLSSALSAKASTLRSLYLDHSDTRVNVQRYINFALKLFIFLNWYIFRCSLDV